ncbi:hypothetical protein COBT_000109 [Conglomerata obtusa]
MLFFFVFTALKVFCLYTLNKANITGYSDSRLIMNNHIKNSYSSQAIRHDQKDYEINRIAHRIEKLQNLYKPRPSEIRNENNFEHKHSSFKNRLNKRNTKDHIFKNENIIMNSNYLQNKNDNDEKIMNQEKLIVDELEGRNQQYLDKYDGKEIFFAKSGQPIIYAEMPFRDMEVHILITEKKQNTDRSEIKNIENKEKSVEKIENKNIFQDIYTKFKNLKFILTDTHIFKKLYNLE